MRTSSPAARSFPRRAILTFATTLGLIGTAWAGAGLAPVGGGEGATGGPGRLATEAADAADAAGSAVGGVTLEEALPEVVEVGAGERLPDGVFLVGADEAALTPDPERWQTEGCSVYLSNFPDEIDHLAGELTEDLAPAGWPRSPDCVYLGGYGLGPARPATGTDPAGYDAQTVAISNGQDVLLWQQTPLVGFFATYRDDLCQDCGILDIRRAIAQELGTEVANVAIGSNHSHGGADGYGAWGGMPEWYRHQIRDALIASARRAVAEMAPARIELGEVDARSFSRERRSTYHSVSDFGAVWLQARALPTDRSDAPRPGEVIATVVNYAAHPTILNDENLLLHGDWPTTVSHELRDQLGGVGLVFEGGLGNVTPSTPRSAERDLTGDGDVDRYDRVVMFARDFTSVIADDVARGGDALTSNTIAAVDRRITHPVTNWTEGALSLVGLLDREFFSGDGGTPGGAYQGSRDGTGQTRPCVSVSPFGLHTYLSGYRVGELTVVTAPGEIFASISLVAKAKLRDQAFEGAQTMVFGQTQDALGYIIQSYENWPPGGVSAGTGGVEYEETFMLDRCFGDAVLETMLELGGQARGADGG